MAKSKKKEIRKAEKVLANLMVKKEESEAIEAAAQKAEIEKVVTQLINSGKPPEDILFQLKEHHRDSSVTLIVAYELENPVTD